MCIYIWIVKLTSHTLALGVVDLQGQRPVLKLSDQVDECVVYPLNLVVDMYVCKCMCE